MPAYRSEAESEIRIPVVDQLRLMIPGCRIIHEINAETFGNRIDVLAVGEDRIAAVEIKSAKDKLDRLPAQIKAMKCVANDVYAAIHEKFLDDSTVGVLPPDEASNSVVWVYPRLERRGHVDCGADWNERSAWRKPVRNLPPRAINILWREELQSVCSGLAVKGASRLNMDQAIDEIRWRMTGEQVTKMICRILRARSCMEADPAIKTTQDVVANDNRSPDLFANVA